MAGSNSGTRWERYTASKTTLFWSCAGCAVATMIVGFTWGGWVTGGTAEKMASTAADAARTDLAATMCVSRFMGGPDVTAQLTALKASNEWSRDDVLDKAGWTTPPGIDKPIQGAGGLCATRLLEAKAAGSAG
ncbi:MAG TPA: hypothetical protein VMB81_01220 [Candidatus Sulfotelmatobacter sp.]|nr:hypothetical protein [Candidatus Sulfotelmatobacter sp.]